MSLLLLIACTLTLLAFGMALQDKAGVEKIVYKATAGDITLNGKDMDTDFEAMIEKITGNSAKGTLRKTGNKRVDFTFNYYDTSVRAAIEADEGDLNAVEIWQLGSASADETISDVELIVQDQFQADPESETPSGLQIRVYRTWYAG